MKKNLLKSMLVALMVMVSGSAWAGDKTVVKYSFDDASSPEVTAGTRVSLDYTKTSVITSSAFLNAWNSTNGDPAASTISLGSTDLSAETWTLSFEWAAVGGCNSKPDHTTLKAGDTNLFDLSGNSNWNTTVTLSVAGAATETTLPVPGCDKSNRFTANTGNQMNTTAYWHHIVVTGSSDGVKLTITNSSTGNAIVTDVVLSETNVNPTGLVIEPCCGGAIGIDELSLTYYVAGEVVQTPMAAYTKVDGINRTITATCDTEGATLYYSLDNENWTEGASVTVSTSGNVYFKAVKGSSESDVLTFAAEAGVEIVLNAPVIVRNANGTVTISADQSRLLLSPTATIYYTYGEENGSFTGSKQLTVAADATITAYAEAEGYAKSADATRAVALFPEAVNPLFSAAAATNGWSANAFSDETITASERTYATLLLDEAAWSESILFQTDGAWGLRASGNWYINSNTANSWILVKDTKAGNIVVVDATFAPAEAVNATYAEKYSFGTKHAYTINADGNAEFALIKPSANEMDYLYGLYGYSLIKEEVIITPAYGTIWENGETTTDENENTNAEIAAAYFNNFAKANDTIRATVVVAAPARTAGPARIIATGNLSVFAGLNPIYEAANIPVGESKLDIALDNEDLAAIAEAGSLKFVYSNLTLKKVELLEGPEPFNPATAIVNNSFENCEAVAESIVTSADAAGTDYAAAGWALTQNGPTWSNAAVFAYGSTAQLNGVAIPAIAPEGCGEKALGVTVGWGGAEIYQSAEAITLPAGTYTLAAYAYNANPAASQMTSKLGFIPTEGEAKVSTVVSYASEAWTVDYVTFTLDAATEGKFQIGGAAISGGSGANAKVFFDQLVLTDAEGLASLQSKAVAANEAIVQAKIAANTALVAGATESNPVAAPFVVNGTFDTTTAPWKSTTGAQNQKLAENQQGAFTGKFFENWNESAFTGKIYQLAENIPNGVYKLNIAAFVNKLADPNESQYVFANADKTFLTTGEPTMYEVYTKVENNTMEFGLEQTTATANWMGIDNISLTYYGAEANIDNIKFAVMLQEVAEALNAKQSVKTKTALETALTNFNAEKTDANIEALKAALAAAKVSINSYRILETGVLPDNSLEGWTCTNTNTFHINTWSSEGNTDGSNMVTPFIENWCNTNDGYLGVGEIYYSLPGLDPGIYQFSALIRAYSESGNEPTGASLFAGNREKEFATGKNFEFNGMKGIYDTYAMACEVGEDGVFKFGIKIAENRNFNWMAFKNCRVAYVGAAITEESVNELAATMPEGKMNAEVKAAAEAATATAKATPNLENYEALAKAIAAAKASAAAYEKLKGVLDFIAEEVAKTNMYTAAAKATFDESIATAQKGYDEGTMSDADAAAFNYGSRLEGLLPTLLLSAYTSDVEGTPYINTWSVEGDNDGSEFKVPFYEYWTGDGNSLAANTITATLTGLEAGNYEVKAWVRVRMKNGAEAPAGITMSVNDETAVDVCAGDQIGTSPLYAKEFTAVGDVFAGDDLKFKFNIAADNTISWLSFKNVKYTRLSETVGITNVKSENKLDGTVYNLNGQKMDKAQKGLYIINGKKVVVK